MTSSFLLWQRWLFAVGLIMAVFGVLLALFDQQINPVFWGAADIPGGAREFKQWVYGVELYHHRAVAVVRH